MNNAHIKVGNKKIEIKPVIKVGQWTRFLIIILPLLLFAAYVFAAPDNKEKQFIQLGELRQEQKMLHERNEVLRNEIESNRVKWNELDVEKSELEASLFQ